jgi:Gly-Xaa carboxypeptidase
MLAEKEKSDFVDDIHLDDSTLPLAHSRSSQTTNQKKAKNTRARGIHLVVILILTALILRQVLWHLLLLADTFLPQTFENAFFNSKDVSERSSCPQAPELVPKENADLWAKLGEMAKTDEFRMRAVDWLGGAVRIPTESYDRMDPVGVDPRWEIFGRFHKYLEDAFPLIHANLEVRKVNTYGLVYVWKGSEGSLKPILLAAHQDVVPVDKTTIDQWVHPPYSGHYDGRLLWGRGASDDKSSLIAIMSAIETLLEHKFTPTRGVVLAFGFDEEASGLHGARTISQHLLESFGKDSFALLVDEGYGFAEQDGAVFAQPGIAEKGYLDVRVEVTSAGGHSSIPPEHTSIGMLAKLLVKYEANPYKSSLARSAPVYKQLQCFAEHAPKMDRKLKKLIQHSVHSDKALKKLGNILFENSVFKSLAGTTQAIDLIQGGVKSNALPERAWAVVNHRIATESSVGAVKEHDTALLKKLAHEFNLTYSAFGSAISPQAGELAPSKGTLTLSDAWGTGLEPAPVTPTGKSPAFVLLSGTIKATYNAHRGLEGDKTIGIAPSIMSGNTDTRYYWDLTRHIFRYIQNDGDAFGSDSALPPGIHTVNEYAVMGNIVEMVRFYTTLILNADESSALD